MVRLLLCEAEGFAYDYNGNTQTLVNSLGTVAYAWGFTDYAVASGSRRTPRRAAGSVLAQPEMEKRRFPLVKDSALSGRGLF